MSGPYDNFFDAFQNWIEHAFDNLPSALNMDIKPGSEEHYYPEPSSMSDYIADHHRAYIESARDGQNYPGFSDHVNGRH